MVSLSHLLVFGLCTLASAKPAAVRQIHEFPLGSWLENLAMRRNGVILATSLSDPELYQINPFNPGTPTTIRFPGDFPLLGITETEPDVFAIIRGQYSVETFQTVPGTYSVWTADFRGCPSRPSHGNSAKSDLDTSCKAKLTEVGKIQAAGLANGMTTLADKRKVLIADSDPGIVYRFDLTTGQYAVAINNPAFRKPSPNAAEGINGIKLVGDQLYLTNAGVGTVLRVRVDPRTGTVRGPVETLARFREDLGYPAPSYYDDLDVDPRDGAAYATTIVANSIVRVAPKRDGSWSQEVIAGDLNSTALAGPTAARFGRTRRDRRTLYVTTSGGVAAPINGSAVVGGQLVAIDL